MVNQASALLTETERARRAISSPADCAPSYTLRRFDLGKSPGQADNSDADDHAQLDLRIELGRTYLPLDDVQTLRHGAVVLLDSLIDEPAAIIVSSRVIGRGEVVVIDGKIGVRITELVK